MTPERAQEIIRLAREKASIGPWSDMLDKVMLPGERQEVNAIWAKMPGHTCFVDALNRIAHEHKAVSAKAATPPPGLRKTGVFQIETCSCGMTRHVWIAQHTVDAGAWS
jgi:hypothetical protein